MTEHRDGPEYRTSDLFIVYFKDGSRLDNVHIAFSCIADKRYDGVEFVYRVSYKFVGDFRDGNLQFVSYQSYSKLQAEQTFRLGNKLIDSDIYNIEIVDYYTNIKLPCLIKYLKYIP